MLENDVDDDESADGVDKPYTIPGYQGALPPWVMQVGTESPAEGAVNDDGDGAQSILLQESRRP